MMRFDFEGYSVTPIWVLTVHKCSWHTEEENLQVPSLSVMTMETVDADSLAKPST